MASGFEGNADACDRAFGGEALNFFNASAS
jgi:hypothetical protein